mmetsp:Transcript_31768/g.78753  ORF Transcript_31768/g.78753 Transcript_31768/m.78753 type:complete len:267 (+) Transcript_31768:4277-5077(+)
MHTTVQQRLHRTATSRRRRVLYCVHRPQPWLRHGPPICLVVGLDTPPVEQYVEADIGEDLDLRPVVLRPNEDVQRALVLGQLELHVDGREPVHQGLPHLGHLQVADDRLDGEEKVVDARPHPLVGPGAVVLLVQHKLEAQRHLGSGAEVYHHRLPRRRPTATGHRTDRREWRADSTIDDLAARRYDFGDGYGPLGGAAETHAPVEEELRGAGAAADRRGDLDAHGAKVGGLIEADRHHLAVAQRVQHRPLGVQALTHTQMLTRQVR